MGGIRPSTIGLILGLTLGYFWLTRSFSFALVLAILALVGWLIGKFISGEVNIAAVREIFSRRS
jgi:uncharacterized membrane protein